MNKIKFAANKDTNYVFHMLSVAKCGYDNAYGERYRNQYPHEELNMSAVQLYRKAMEANK